MNDKDEARLQQFQSLGVRFLTAFQMNQAAIKSQKASEDGVANQHPVERPNPNQTPQRNPRGLESAQLFFNSFGKSFALVFAETGSLGNRFI